MIKPSILFSFLLMFSFAGFAQDSTHKSSTLCEKPVLADKFPSFSGIPQYFDYTQARRCQAASGKKLLIYFTAKYSANSRKIERDVLADTSIIRQLQNFVIVTLFVDDEKVGKTNLALEQRRYMFNVQPLFVIEPLDGDAKNLVGGATKDEFMRFLLP
jgi:hypothetical protein